MNTIGTETKASNPKFLSTNDILCSAFFTAANCDTALIAVNFRNRVDNLNDNHAGNYESIIAYRKEDILKPEYIRLSLPNYKSISGTMPTTLWERCFLTCALLTNWSSFYTEIEFSKSSHILHMPIFSITQIPVHAAILYSASKEKLALMTLEEQNWSDAQILKNDVVLGRIAI
jgi:hypothetical protein